MKEKRLYGQYFTINNPFELNIFMDWFKKIPDKKKERIVEPFAGANNIVKMIHDVGINSKWECFDIEPPEENNFNTYKINKRDTLESFPKDFFVGITNPPYLAKNSATRRKLDYPTTIHDDLYKYSLEIMLNNLEYVAAIIPESFITQNLFTDRLYAVSSLTCKMFDDTDCPVCLALFVPSKKNKNPNNFRVYNLDDFIGYYDTLKKKEINASKGLNLKFNDKEGNIGVICIDNSKEASIRFVKGSEINSEDIKVSSRAFTRISGLPDDIDVDVFIKKCNKSLKKYRKETNDVFLTSFKGLRTDGKYRRRLDFSTIKNIMNKIYNK